MHNLKFQNNNLEKTEEEFKKSKNIFNHKALKHTILENDKFEETSEKTNELEIMKKAEINRIIKVSMNRGMDDRLYNQLEKITRFLFGKKEGEEIYTKFINENRVT